MEREVSKNKHKISREKEAREAIAAAFKEKYGEQYKVSLLERMGDLVHLESEPVDFELGLPQIQADRRIPNSWFSSGAEAPDYVLVLL